MDFEEVVDYLTDDEAEKALNSLLDDLAAKITEQESGPSVTNPKAVRALITVYKAAKRLVTGKSVRVSYALNTPFRSMGNVTIEGRELVFRSPLFVGKAAELASNLEIYPLVNGGVRMTYTFHDLTVFE